MTEIIEIKNKLVRSYKDLNVYQKAYTSALAIHKMAMTFPKMEQYEMASQMRRASKGICANIAEGFAKQSSYPAEFSRFLGIATGSANEMLVWINFCYDLGYIDFEIFQKWSKDYESIAKMLMSLKS